MANSRIFETKQDAIDHLLGRNYGVDGKTMVARYWTGNKHTEIASVVGIFHNTNGVQNVEIKDGSGGGDGDCKVTYWDTEYMHENGVPVGEGFKTRNGAYNGTFEELHGTDDGYLHGKEGKEMIRQDTPLLYITPVKDERRGYNDINSWFGSGWSYRRVQTNTPYYSVLTMFHPYDRTREPGLGSHKDPYYKGVVIDPRKYEKKIHKALYLASSSKVKNFSYVIKKTAPLYPNAHHRYYYQGGFVKFMIPAVAPGHRAEIRFSKQTNRYVQSYWTLKRHFWNGHNYWDEVQAGNIQLTWDDIQYEYNRLIIKNNMTDQTTPVACISLQCSNNNRPVVLIPKTDSIAAFCATDMSTSSKINSTNGGVDRDLLYDYTSKYEIKRVYYPFTSETTSPGFRIEEGKIKCYRSSDFRKLIPTYLNVKHTKDGASFYYNERNIYNCGIGQRTVEKQQAFINSLTLKRFDSAWYISKEKGKIEYLGVVSRGKISKNDLYMKNLDVSVGDANDYICCIEYGSLTAIGDGNYSLKVIKTESRQDVGVDYVGVSFVGTDGEFKEGRFVDCICEEGENGRLPAARGTYTLILKNFEIKVRNGGTRTSFYYGYSGLDSSFDGTLRVKYMRSEAQENGEIPIRYISSGSLFSNSFNWSRTKWKVLNKRSVYPRVFRRSKFVTCRYFRKYKGVTSEFPETFYLR